MKTRIADPVNQHAPKLPCLLSQCELVLGADRIYSPLHFEYNVDQQAELKVRERDASQHYDDYLAYIARHYSIPVMDSEVNRYLAYLPSNALVLDIGGCFGWHWRHLAESRPDVGVVIIDFVRQNLVHAQRVLGSLVGTQVALIHADATALPFPDAKSSSNGFDGVWTVQVLQHIPKFELACREAYRVLNPGGRFTNYSLHNTPLNRMIYWLFGKHYHTAGLTHTTSTKPGEGQMHLNRATDDQYLVVAQIFGGSVKDRYTECLFNLELRLTFTGRAGSWLGQIDAHLGDYPSLGRWIARQRSFEATKS